MSTRFQFKVLGETGKVRAKGELAFVLPQALDLVSKSSYVASISEATSYPRGVLRLRGTDSGDIEAQYIHNPIHPAPEKDPAWIGSITNLSRQLGRNVTWPTQT